MEAPQITQRLLSRLRVLYGDKFSAQWADVSKEELASAWHADVTLRFGVEQIRRALEHLTTNSTFPPTLPEFVSLCRQFRPTAATTLYLPAPVSRMPPEIADQLKAFIHHVRGGDDCRKWARKIVANPKNYPGLSRQYALEALGVSEQDAVRGCDNYELIAAVSERCPVEAVHPADER